MDVRRLAPAIATAVGLATLAACGAATEPTQPASTSPVTASASPTPAPTPTPTASPSVDTGLTLQQLGFDNGPAEFSLPPGAVITTKVDQPNVVTVVLSAPSSQIVESYLRSTLPDEGFTIDARSMAEGALTFKGNGWTGGFTGTGTSSAIVLRPA